MDTITILYFHLSKLPNCPWEHGQQFPNTTRKRNALIGEILSLGYNAMMVNTAQGLAIYVDKGMFRQR